MVHFDFVSSPTQRIVAAIAPHILFPYLTLNRDIGCINPWLNNNIPKTRILLLLYLLSYLHTPPTNAPIDINKATIQKTLL